MRERSAVCVKCGETFRWTSMGGPRKHCGNPCHAKKHPPVRRPQVGRPRSTTCRDCGLGKATNPDDFYVVGAYVDGTPKLSNQCRACQADYAKGWYVENRDDALAARKSYYKRASAENPEQFKGYAANYYRNNADRVREIARKHASARRAALASAPACWYAAERYVDVILADPCVYCGEPTEHIDHVLPVVDGGAHAWENLAPTCARCNQRKNRKQLLDFMLVRLGEAA